MQGSDVLCELHFAPVQFVFILLQGKPCQVSHWRTHKPVCLLLKRIKEIMLQEDLAEMRAALEAYADAHRLRVCEVPNTT